MKTRENGLWKWLNGGRPPGCLLHRVENSIDVGTPDVIGKFEAAGPAFWIELKVADAVGRDGLRVPHLIAEQVSFLRRWQAAGTPSSLLVQLGQGNEARRWLIPAKWAHCLLDSTVSVEWMDRHSPESAWSEQGDILRAAAQI